LLSAVAILAGIGIAAVSLASADGGEAVKGPPGKEAAKVPPGGIKVSRETTFITEPLRKDGSVDYLAALNQRYSQGVTPENNAAMLFLQAMGPGEINKDIRERFFKMLGIEPLAEKGLYLEHFPEFFERKHPEIPAPNLSKIASKQYERIMDRPWSKTEFPVAAGWLEENQLQLDVIVAATKRPRFYTPMLTYGGEGGLLIATLLPLARQSRDAARALRARAMFRIDSGKGEEAWQDLLACHRLARLVSEGAFLVDGLVAMAIEGIAIHGDAVLAHEGKLTAEQAQRFAAELRKLPPMGKMVDKNNWSERFMYLDCVYAVARKGPAEISKLSWVPPARGRFDWLFSVVTANKMAGAPPAKGRFDWLNRLVGAVLIDWNEPMRMGNQWYDRLVAGMSNPNRKERDAALAQFERDVKRTAADVRDLRVFLRDVASSGSLRTATGRTMGRIFIALLMPALTAVVNAEDRAVTSEGMTQVVFALAAYRADHGSYPADLAALVPKYLPAVPEDLFSGGPIRYKREDTGYIVYSVGINRKDDGGRTFGEGADDEGCDDWVIRVPGKKQ
jgi:hypothetical protein